MSIGDFLRVWYVGTTGHPLIMPGALNEPMLKILPGDGGGNDVKLQSLPQNADPGDVLAWGDLATGTYDEGTDRIVATMIEVSYGISVSQVDQQGFIYGHVYPLGQRIGGEGAVGGWSADTQGHGGGGHGGAGEGDEGGGEGRRGGGSRGSGDSGDGRQRRPNP